MCASPDSLCACSSSALLVEASAELSPEADRREASTSADTDLTGVRGGGGGACGV